MSCDYFLIFFSGQAFYLNSIPLGVHRGGYDPFNLSLPEICETRLWLTIRAWDPTDEGCAFTDTPPIPCAWARIGADGGGGACVSLLASWNSKKVDFI